jgi:hypothetical protein
MPSALFDRLDADVSKTKSSIRTLHFCKLSEAHSAGDSAWPATPLWRMYYCSNWFKARCELGLLGVPAPGSRAAGHVATRGAD